MLQRCLGNTHAINNISLLILFAYVLGRYMIFGPAEGTVGSVFLVRHNKKEVNFGEINVFTDLCSLLYYIIFNRCLSGHA